MKKKELYKQMCRLQSRLDRIKNDFERLLGEIARDMERQESLSNTQAPSEEGKT